MRKLLAILMAGVSMSVLAAATSCIVEGYEGNLARPLAGTCAEKTVGLPGHVEGLTRTSRASSAGLFDSFVWFARETEPGRLCSLPLGLLIIVR